MKCQYRFGDTECLNYQMFTRNTVSILSERSATKVAKTEIKLKSLILAQIERWRHALHMQVERQRGATWRRVANG
jgi:hypothetical protein